MLPWTIAVPKNQFADASGISSARTLGFYLPISFLFSWFQPGPNFHYLVVAWRCNCRYFVPPIPNRGPCAFPRHQHKLYCETMSEPFRLVDFGS